jgi:O-antigen/teichoic acid export membrane protein
VTVDGGAARRAVLGFFDQAASSLINFAVGFLIARTVSDDEFGAFSIAFSFYVAVLVFVRALASEPFLIRHSGSDPAPWRVAVSASTGVALLVGLLGGLALALVGIVLGGSVGEAMVPLGIVLPGLVLLDTMRFAFIARARPQGALACDVAWLVLLVAALLAIDVAGISGLVPPIAAWGGSALAVVIIALVATSTSPSPREAVRWLRIHADIAPRYAAEALIALTATQVTIIIVGVIAGLAAAGGLRGAQLLIGPMQVLLIGLGSIAVPEGAALVRAGGPRRLLRPTIGVSVGLTVTVLVYGVLLMAMPDQIGTMLLGETWPQAEVVLGPLVIAYAGVSGGLGAAIGLRVLADARTSLRSRVVDATAQTTGGVGGAWVGGAFGAASGLAIGSWIGAAVAWLSYRSSLRRAIATDAQPPTPAPDAGMDGMGVAG